MKKLIILLLALILALPAPAQAQAPHGFAVIRDWSRDQVTITWTNPGVDLEGAQGVLQFYDPSGQYYQIPLMYMGFDKSKGEYLWHGLPQDIRSTFPCGLYHVVMLGIGNAKTLEFYADPTDRYRTVYCKTYLPVGMG